MDIRCKLGIHKDRFLGGTPSNAMRLTHVEYYQCDRCLRIVKLWGIFDYWKDKVKLDEVPSEIRWQARLS